MIVCIFISSRINYCLNQCPLVNVGIIAGNGVAGNGKDEGGVAGCIVPYGL